MQGEPCLLAEEVGFEPDMVYHIIMWLMEITVSIYPTFHPAKVSLRVMADVNDYRP